MTRKKLTTAQRIIRKAAQTGSQATTVAGALAYLRTHLPPPLAGLMHLRSPESHRPAREPRECGPDSRTPGVAWNHDARAERRARTLVDRLIKTTPERAFSALARRKGHLTPDILERAKRLLRQVIAGRLGEHLLAHWPYRRSGSAWAGGGHTVTVTIGAEPAARGGSERAWSRNGKWSGTNSYANLCVTPRCYEALGTGLAIDCLVTLDCEAVGRREYAAAWAEQGRGFALRVVRGWIVRGYHVAGGTLEAARRKAAKARRERLATLYIERVGLKGLDLARLLVKRADSLAAGNCAAGTDSFIRSHRLEDRGSVPANELLALADNVETRAAVLRAAVRTLAEGRLTGVALGEEGEGIDSGVAANDAAPDASEAAGAALG